MFIDTIVAQSTPYGRSSVGMLRISGKSSKIVTLKILGKIPSPRCAYYSKFLNNLGIVIDSGIAIWIPKPHSFTGEDILELQCHGNPIILDLLTQVILSVPNVRLANPGEFSERAFLNGKIDLVQAESIMDLINSNSEAGVKSSLQSLQGVFSREINILIDKITKIRVLIEAIINFPEDDTNISKKMIKKKIKNISSNINNIYNIAHSGSVLKEGVRVVIVGKPNAGKSSLFNALLLNESAIVTDIEGTTRDVLHDYIQIDGIEFKLTDTAGLRTTKNIIEIMGIRKTLEEIKLADHVLLIIDDTISLFKKDKIISDFMITFPPKKRITILFNKSDISGNKSYFQKSRNKLSYIHISAKTGYGIEILKKHLKIEAIGLNNFHENGIFIARRRHLNILKLSIKNIKKAEKNWTIYQDVTCLAEDLKLIQNILGEITGIVTSNHILNKIFSDFCIGK